MADEIIARNEGGSAFPIPAEDSYVAVCADVIDLGMHTTPKYPGKLQHKIALVFQLDATDPSGKRFELAQRFTLSMYESAYLRKFLGQWRGKSFTDEEAEEGAPLHKLVGVNGVITVEHNKVGEKTYANILSIGKLMPGMQRIQPKDYVRAEYWEKVKEAGGLKKLAPAGAAEMDAEADKDDDLPF